ncbi:MaoC like domain-containing protein [Roseovarius pacificus]|uniref:MaoC like domain-containing protein n=1 Tax=Roseovarius pacificus TaxID=337701 RepID=A0A1M7KHU1_9RHOB|nr:MaoC/PaaZ C-terminal domain-containing protein [Roseovarius pacificus]GGO62743.1 hypothetical protein GCM10011315_42450 [Roseovarius pacificus]SHM64872.1 MaoC like domain-containing protein [Roseovarius pacificus]
MTDRSDHHALPDNLDLGQLQTTPEMTERYAALTDDYNPIHLDADFASKTAFGAPIIHGTMGLNLLVESLETTFGDSFPELRIDVRFIRPVRVGSTIRARGRLTDANARRYEIFVETETGDRAVEGTCNLGPPAPISARDSAKGNNPEDHS